MQHEVVGLEMLPDLKNDVFFFFFFVLVVCCLAKLKFSLYPLFQASRGDMGHAVGLLTTQHAELQDAGEPQESGTSGETWERQKGTLWTKQAIFRQSRITR